MDFWDSSSLVSDQIEGRAVEEFMQRIMCRIEGQTHLQQHPVSNQINQPDPKQLAHFANDVGWYVREV